MLAHVFNQLLFPAKFTHTIDTRFVADSKTVHEALVHYLLLYLTLKMNFNLNGFAAFCY